MISRVLLFEILLLCLLKFSCATSLEEEEEEEEWRAHCKDCSFELHSQHACLLLHWNSQLLHDSQLLLLLVRWRWPVSFFLSISLLLLLLLLLPDFCFFFWWGQFVWQQKKQKGNSIDKRGGKKNLCFRISSLKQKAEVSQFLLTHTYLDTKKLHWFFLWYILFVHKQTHHKNSISPFHSISFHVEESQFWCCLSSTQERRIKSPKFHKHFWEANIACEFQGSSLIVVMTLERFHHSSYYFPEGQLLFQMHDDTNTVEDYQIVYKLTNKSMWQNLSWVSIMSRNRHSSNSPLARLGSHNGHHLIHFQSTSVLIHSNALFFFLVFFLKFVIWNIWSFFPKS